MQKSAEALENALLKEGVISKEKFDAIVKKHSSVQESSDALCLLLQASGFPIEKDDVSESYFLTTLSQKIKDAVFCIVDLETNGGKPDNSQIIEIGAVKIQNGVVIDSFDSLVHCAYVPQYVTKITGIATEDLKDAPKLKEVLTKFKEFLSGAIFVAHNVDFDYKFLSNSFKRQGLGELANRKVCTIDLAKKTIQSPKYGLKHLNEELNLENESHHRALSDAKATAKLFSIVLDKLPQDVETVEDLISFSKHNQKKRKKKKTAK
jgi:DNA polymerase-3 subunit epsilon